MATLWPRTLPQSIRQDRRRRAEVRVYDRLAAELDDSFHVFYSSPWLGTDQLGNEKDGECDFLVAHARLGYLTLEVKGGGISFDPAARQWWSTDAQGFRHAIRDPVEQARSAKHEMLEKLQAAPRWRERWIRMVHAVVFPDAAKIPRNLGADRPPHIFCCAAEFAGGFRAWIESRMNEGVAGEFQPLGADGLAAFEQILAQPFTLSFRLAGAMAEAAEQLGVLEPTQFHVLEHIADVPRAEIRGGAGTGKTVIAIEDARRSATAERRTLLTCHSKPLSLELERRLVGIPGLTVANFQAVCMRLAHEAGLAVPADRSQDFFDNSLPELLIDAVTAHPELRWHHIIVDEGQDFRQHWWLAIGAALLPGGTLRIFSDSNQRVYNDRAVHQKDLQLVPIRLGRNLRNTKAIHSAASVHYQGPDIVAEGPDGRDVKWIEANTRQEMVNAAYAEIRNLIYQEELSPADLAVLVPNAEWIEALRVAAARSNLEFADSDDLSTDRIILDTARRFKGLERPAIIAILPGGDAAKVEMAYVCLSRGRYYLAVISSAAEFRWLRQ